MTKPNDDPKPYFPTDDPNVLALVIEATRRTQAGDQARGVDQSYLPLDVQCRAVIDALVKAVADDDQDSAADALSMACQLEVVLRQLEEQYHFVIK